MTSKNINDYFIKSSSVILKIAEDLPVIQDMARIIYKSQLDGNKLLVAGNGGSCADAQHFVGEMTCTFLDRARRPFSAISLTTNTSSITAWSNDFEYKTYIARQVEALGKTGDVLFLLSTSGGNKEKGTSMNVVLAAEKAKAMGIKVFALTGEGGGELARVADACIKIKSNLTSHIQEGHISVIHAICMQLEYFCQQ